MARILVALIGTVLMVHPSLAGSEDWVFKGQPKDTDEHYQKSESKESSKSRHLKLVVDCDKAMDQLVSLDSEGSRSDLSSKKSRVLALNSCGLLYGADHQEEKAKACLYRSLELAKSIKDIVEQARIWNYLGIVYALWGQFSHALDSHEKSLALSAGCSNHENQAISYNQIGQIAMLMGNYRKACDFLEKSLAIQSSAPEDVQLCLTLDNLGQLNEGWGNWQKALDYYRRSLRLKEKLGLTGGQVASWVLLGRIHSLLEQDEEALSSFRIALKLCEKHGYPTDLVIDRIGNLYLDRGEKLKAAEYIEQAGFWQSLGRLHLMIGDLPAAQNVYLKLMNYSKTRRMADYLWVAHTGLGVIKERQGDLFSAEGHFRAAIRTVESIRMGLTLPERAEFFQGRVGGFFRTAPYKGLARVLVQMNKPREAFRESEFTKARTFAEVLSRQPDHPRADVPAEVVAVDTDLNQRIAAIKRALNKAYEENDQKMMSVLESQAKTTEDELAAHVASVRSRYPLFASTRYPEPMDLTHTALKNDELVLAYDVSDSGIIIYLIKGKKILRAVFKPVSKEELDSLIRKFRAPMKLESGGSIVLGLRKFDFNAGRKLSEILLSEILPDLPINSPLIVVPDEMLGVLPFEMLILNNGGRVDAGREIPTIMGADFFGDRNSISYYQSLTALTLVRTLRRQQRQPGRILAMVDPVFSTDDPRFVQLPKKEREDPHTILPSQILMSIKRETGITFPRLPLTGELGHYFKETAPKSTDLCEGLQASRKVLLEKDLTEYGAIVFATHGYFGRDLPGVREPVLVLSPFNERENDDGFLRLSEVMGLKMYCGIAALTACQTGLGRQISGEGTMGMGRAFQYAGAKSVLISLWSVEESSSVKLVESFFRHLRAGKSRPASLQSARNEIRKMGYDHPFFWSSFILVGEVE